jgi:ribosomal-protein-alanine N-acetyltransferase
LRLVSLHDRMSLAAWLRSDIAMNSFALCDLDSSQWDQTMWLAVADHGEVRSVALIYFGPGGPFVNVLGERPARRELLAQAADILPPSFHLSAEASLDEPVSIKGRALAHVQDFKRMIPGESVWQGYVEPPNIVSLDAAAAQEIRSLLIQRGANPSAWFQERTLASGLYRGWIERGELAGTVGVHAWSDEQKIAVVGNLGVVPQLRRKGIGRILMESILADLQTKGWDIAFNVAVGNRPALALYERMGCREVGTVREYRVG